ncbi:MAG: CehA/McbA family metallohydrolase [Vicinamibacterales bacterium]
MVTCILLALALLQPAATSEVVLEGTITAKDRLAWLERAFEIPAGTARIDIDTSFTEREQGTALEFGVYDPLRFRGASRFSKSSFFLSRTAATPSYYPGDLPAGTWRLLMGVPTIRDGVTSRYRIVVRLTADGPSQPSPTGLAPGVAASGPRWYQGDLHTHTLHSDGFGCADGRGGAGPCGVPQVVEAAARRGLDFVAVTDHNTTSHHQELVNLQPRYDRMLLLRGQEVTTFYGHANVYGTSEVVDFRIGHPGVTARDVFAQAHRLGALVSVNHPARETGEKCTGCGWNAPGTDWAQVDAIEVVNQFILTGPTAGEPFWQARLNEGRRLTGVGGSDDHGASTRAGSAVGTPTNVIYADALTEAGLLAGLRAGHVYIKTRGPEGPDVRFTAPELKASMGDAVTLGGPRQRIQLRIVVINAAGQHVDLIRNGTVIDSGTPGPLAGNDVTLNPTLEVARGDSVRINIRDSAGVTVITNPIYFR